MIQNRKIVVALVGLMILIASAAVPATPFGYAWVKNLVLNGLSDWIGRRVEVRRAARASRKVGPVGSWRETGE